MIDVLRRQSERKKTSQRSFRNAVVKVFGSKCSYCHVDLVDMDRTPPERRFAIIQDEFIWQDSHGVMHRDFFLTLDHILPIWQGGLTILSNVIPACQSCNRIRNHRDYERPVHTVKCKFCGKPSKCTKNCCKSCKSALRSHMQTLIECSFYLCRLGEIPEFLERSKNKKLKKLENKLRGLEQKRIHLDNQIEKLANQIAKGQRCQTSLECQLESLPESMEVSSLSTTTPLTAI